MTLSRENYTQTPNDLFDIHMRDMGDAELRVVLAATRKLLGFHKKREAISLTQFQEMTGLSRQGVMNGLAQAIEHNHIRLCEERGKRRAKLYELVVSVDQSTALVNQVDQSTPLTNEVDQNKSTSITSTGQPSRHTKEKENKDSNKDTQEKESVAVRTPPPQPPPRAPAIKPDSDIAQVKAKAEAYIRVFEDAYRANGAPQTIQRTNRNKEVAETWVKDGYRTEEITTAINKSFADGNPAPFTFLGERMAKGRASPAANGRTPQSNQSASTQPVKRNDDALAKRFAEQVRSRSKPDA